MTEQGKYINCTKKSITYLGLQNSTAWLIPSNALIISMYASVGEVCINQVPLATSQAIFGMIVKDTSMIDYLYYYLSYYKDKKLYKYLQTGSQSNINADFVKSILIPDYGKKNNLSIGKLLNKIDEKLQKEKDILNTYKRQKAYLLQNMFI